MSYGSRECDHTIPCGVTDSMTVYMYMHIIIQHIISIIIISPGRFIYSDSYSYAVAPC